MQRVPLAPIPSQRLDIVLGGQNCKVSVHQRGELLYIDLAVDLTPVVRSRVLRNRIRVLLDTTYRGFRGDLVMVDTQGAAQPEYDELGTRFQLYYLSADELNGV